MHAHQRDVSTRRREYRVDGFVVGLLAGTVVGAGLTMWLAPRTRWELRQRLAGSARSLGQRASEQYEEARVRVGGAVDELGRKGQGFREQVADVVARGAQEVERYATSARGDRH